MVFEDAASWGMPVELPGIVTALREVIQSGLAKAYKYAGNTLGELQGMPSIEEMETPHLIYYYLTPKGRELQQSDNDDWPPWDEHGELRKDWVPPTE
jgi:hypothetical protein